MSKLYLVPTPIGNLKDITLRAIEVLNNVDFILAEDTRKSKNLLNHYSISAQLISFHKYNEHKKLQKIINELESGMIYALICDAGTPSISDPGFLLVRESIKNNIQVEVLPGATAFVPALVASGLSSDKFVFEGFLPVKKGRSKTLLKLAEETRTIILYESPHRVLKTLEALIKTFGNERQASVSRELTKIYDETKRGSLEEIYKYFSEKKIKGEFVIVISGQK